MWFDENRLRKCVSTRFLSFFEGLSQSSSGGTQRPSASCIKTSAEVTSRPADRAAADEKSVGEATFDLTGAAVASGADRRPRRRSSELRQ